MAVLGELVATGDVLVVVLVVLDVDVAVNEVVVGNATLVLEELVVAGDVVVATLVFEAVKAVAKTPVVVVKVVTTDVMIAAVLVVEPVMVVASVSQVLLIPHVCYTTVSRDLHMIFPRRVSISISCWSRSVSIVCSLIQTNSLGSGSHAFLESFLFTTSARKEHY